MFVKGCGVVRTAESLSTVAFRSDAEIRYPERIFANNLRKHTATIAQVLSLDDNDIKWICNHLGHTQKVHDNYRQTSGMIERIEIAKLMLLQENNLVGKFVGQKLADIQFEATRIKWSKEEEAEPQNYFDLSTGKCLGRQLCMAAISSRGPGRL